MIVLNTKLPKLCHARPGDAVRLVSAETGEPTDDLFIVSVDSTSPGRPARQGMPHGLYDDQRPLFLVNLETGLAVRMPHLSSRVEIVREARVVTGACVEGE